MHTSEIVARATCVQRAGTGHADPWHQFAADLDAGGKTRETYARALRRYRRYLEDANLGEFEATRETVLDYRRTLEEEGKSAATVNCYLTAVRSFYRWAETRRTYPNVAAGIKGERINTRGAKDSLTREQAAEIIAVDRTDLKGLRDRAMINLMVRRGLRTVEVTRANIGDIRQLNGEAVLYVQGKGYADKGEFVVLGNECLEPIYEYLEARGESDPAAPLFAATGNRNRGGRMTTRSISRVVKDRMASCGISSARLTAHSLRHTAVTFALLGGATVQEAQAMARHASIETTMIYAHNLDRMRAGAERAADRFIDAVGVNTL